MHIVKGTSQNNFQEKYLGVEFNHKKIQEAMPTYIEQDTKIQTLIRMTNCSEDTLKFQKVRIR